MVDDYLLGVLLLIGGAIMIVTAERQAQKARDRMRSGKDTYFEERRELAAYPQLHKTSAIRRSGWMMIACSIVVIGFQVL